MTIGPAPMIMMDLMSVRFGMVQGLEVCSRVRRGFMRGFRWRA
jgi:hypothetical protein